LWNLTIGRSDDGGKVGELLDGLRSDHHHGHAGLFPRGELSTDVVDVTDDGGVVDEFVRNDRGCFIFTS
jgi:hypothetical protein